jgi:hypothetical protein
MRKGVTSSRRLEYLQNGPLGVTRSSDVLEPKGPTHVLEGVDGDARAVEVDLERLALVPGPAARHVVGALRQQAHDRVIHPAPTTRNVKMSSRTDVQTAFLSISSQQEAMC